MSFRGCEALERAHTSKRGSDASRAAAVLYRTPLRYVSGTDRIRRPFRDWARYRPNVAKPVRAPFFQPFQDRHQLHRDRHNNIKSGRARLFHGQRDQRGWHSAGLERAAASRFAQPSPDFFANRSPGCRFLALLENETLSL